MNIVLTGFMGTGKTETGKILAKKLGWQFFDTDLVIEKEVGMKVNDIFERNGEPYFRNAETNTVKLISLLDRVVISCGGGVVLKQENMDALEKTGKIVCLTAMPQVIFERVKNTSNRPLLKVKDPIAVINELLEKRKSAYLRCDLMIDTSDMDPVEVADKILAEYKLG